MLTSPGTFEGLSCCGPLGWAIPRACQVVTACCLAGRWASFEELRRRPKGRPRGVLLYLYYWARSPKNISWEMNFFAFGAPKGPCRFPIGDFGASAPAAVWPDASAELCRAERVALRLLSQNPESRRRVGAVSEEPISRQQARLLRRAKTSRRNLARLAGARSGDKFASLCPG